MGDVIDVVMPEQHEGTKATVLRWCRGIGDRVVENEPLVELETDKVTVEISAPASGELIDILKAPNDPVEPLTVLARLRTGAAVEQRPVAAVATQAAAVQSQTDTNRGAPLSPAVRRLLAEHGLTADQISGSGRGGRITAEDILRHVDSSPPAQRTPPATMAARPAATTAPPAATTARPAATPARPAATPAPHAVQPTEPPSALTPARSPSSPAARPAPPTPGVAPAGSRKVPHSAVRRRIAEHMVASMAAAPHVTTLFEADLTRVLAHRDRQAADFAARGAKLTLTSYFITASVRALQAVPEVNATFHADRLEIHGDCNVGVGTALGNEGLIVPVLHQAQTLDLFAISQRLGTLVGAARAGKLAPEAVRGGTFTISNHGVGGSILAAPIVINQPQVAILGIGKLERRVVAQQIDGEDVIRVRPRCYVTLTIDHRALDAFQANAFLTALVRSLDEWPD